MAPTSVRGLLLCGAAIIACGPAFGQDTTTGTEDLLFLDTIVVDSQREVATDTAVPVTRIDNEEIQDRQAGSVAELLDSVPGVTLVNGSTATGSAINIRGMGAWSGTYGSDQSVLILIDGATVGGEELYRIGTQLYTDPALYKTAEVVRGTVGSFEYGSGVIGGMVQFETADASDFTGGAPGFRARQTLGYNTNGHGRLSSTILAWQPSEDLEFLANYTWRDLGRQEDGDGDDLGAEGTEQPSWLVKGTWHFGAARDQSLTLSYSDTSISERDVPYDQFGTTDFGNVDRDIRSRTAVLSYEWDPASALIDTEVTLSHADQDIESTAIVPGNPLLDADPRYRTTKLTAKNTARFELGATGHDLVAGVELSRRDRTDESSAPGGIDDRFALFVVDDIRWRGFTLTPALRYEDQRVEGKGQYADDEYENDALMGGVSLRHEWDNGIAVFGSVAYTEGLPIIDDMANPVYMEQPQKARTYELGASYASADLFGQGDALALKVNLYQSLVWDITAYSNVQKIELSGLELEAAYSMANGFYTDVNAAFAYDEQLSPETATGHWSQEPADQLRVGLGKRFGETYDLHWETVYNFEMDRAATPTDDSLVHNLGLTWTPQDGRLAGIELRARVENLFDLDYRQHLATRDAPGRNLKLSLARTF